MLTQGKIDQFYEDVESLGLKKKVSDIQKATGFPKSNVSEWLGRKKTPSERFIDAFYTAFYESSTSVPRSTFSGKGENQYDPQGNTVLPVGDLKVTLKDHFDLLKDVAEKAEREKDRLYNLLENKLSDLLVNSKTTLEALSRIHNLTAADDAVNLAAIDKAQRLAPGTSAAVAGTAERALNNLTEEDDTKEIENKQGKKGISKKQKA